MKETIHGLLVEDVGPAVRAPCGAPRQIGEAVSHAEASQAGHTGAQPCEQRDVRTRALDQIERTCHHSGSEAEGSGVPARDLHGETSLSRGSRQVQADVLGLISTLPGTPRISVGSGPVHCVRSRPGRSPARA